MNYQKIHDDIINRAKDRAVDGYTESHHITPKCMGGSDDRTNLVDLTAREHFVIHQLLVKIYPKHKGIIYAARTMTLGPRRMNNRLYEWLKIKFANALSEEMKGNTLSKFRRSEATKKKMSDAQKKRWREKPESFNLTNQQTGSRKPMSPETKKKISEAGMGRIFTDDEKKKISEGLKRSLNNSNARKLKSTLAKKQYRVNGKFAKVPVC